MKRNSSCTGRLQPIIVLSAVFAFIVCCTASAAAQDNDLDSPVFGTYNSFLDVIDILELVAVGTNAVEATVSAYNQSGALQNSVDVTIPAGNQVDVIINDLISNRTNRYGVVRISFNDGSAQLEGRISSYRLNRDGTTYSFVFARQLMPASTGTTYAISNSFDPQGEGFLVPNWLQLTNLESDDKTFTVNLYDQTGALLSTSVQTLSRFERIDLSAGHERGEGVFLNEVIPTDTTGGYIAAVTRYGSDDTAGETINDFSFATAIDSSAGSSEDQYTLVSNKRDTGFCQFNWIELANVSNATVSATVEFFEESGGSAGTSNVTLPAKSQFHFLGSSMISENTFGSAIISTTGSDNLLAQTTVYYRGCSDSSLQTAYALPAILPIRSPIVGSFNRFLSMQNDLIVLSASGVSRTVANTVRSGGSDLFSDSFTLGARNVSTFNLNDEDTFSTMVDTFGTVTLDSNSTSSFTAFVIRTRMDQDEVDFVNPTLFR